MDFSENNMENQKSVREEEISETDEPSAASDEAEVTVTDETESSETTEAANATEETRETEKAPELSESAVPAETPDICKSYAEMFLGKTYKIDEKPRKKPARKGSAVLASVISAVVAVVITLQVVFCCFYYDYNKKLQAKYNEYAEDLQKAYDTIGDFAKLAEMKNYIDKTYIYDFDEDALMRQLEYDMLLCVGDRFASYYTSDEWQKSYSESHGSSVGIGVYVIYKNDGIYISHVMSGGPAEKFGILEGDTIIAVDGQKVSDVGYNTGVELIAGEPGTSVNLTVLRDGKTQEMSVVRNNYTVETVIANTISDERGKLGYVRVIQFDYATVDQFKSAVDALLRDGCEGLIFDMRDNPGGEVDAVVGMVDYLVPKGPIVHFKDLDGNVVETYYSGSSCVKCPMVVITNDSTASAAEIFTISLRDYKMATVVGEKTFGKGCCQVGEMLSDGSVIFITAYLYDPPFSENYDGVGIYPDIEVATPEAFVGKSIFFMEYEDDVQLQVAIGELYKLCQ